MRSNQAAGMLRAAFVAAFTLTAPFGAVAQQQRPAAVEVTRAEVRQLAPTVRATGVVQARQAADLAAGVAGRLEWVADPGTVADENTVVARIDVSELRLARAEQAARAARAELNLQSMERELARLQASGTAVSRFELDQAQSNRDLAKADLDVARALVAQTDEQLARSELHAPFAGVVSERLKRGGEEVARGEVVARLVDPDELEIRLFLPLRHVRAVRVGEVVNVIADGRPFTAQVRAIVPAGDPRSQSFEVLVEAPDVDGLLAAGNTVDVVLPLGTPQQMLAVPRDALVIRADGVYVFRVTAESTAQRIPVTTGVADGDWVGVTGELQPEDPVIVRGAELLRGNETVQIVGVLDQEAQLADQERRPHHTEGG